MQECIDLISSSPEPELPKNRAKVAPIVAPKAPLKNLSQNIPRPPTVQLFDFSFANFDNATSIETAKVPPPNPSIRSPRPKASKIIPLDDGNELQLWSDDFDTTIGSVLNGASAKRDTGNSKQQQGDNAPIEITDSDDPFASPPPAKRQKASPPKDKFPRAAGGYKRTVSNIESVRSSKARPPKYSLNRSNSLGADPLLFTSSPDASAARSKYGKGKVPSIQYDDDDDDEVEIPRKKPSKPIFLDVEDEDDFPSIENLKYWNPPPRRSKAIEEPMLHHYDDDSTPEKKKREKVDKSKEKASSAAEKKAAKDAEREQKRIDKEYAKAEKEREKEKAKDLAKVNVDRTKPEISTPEMIVDLPSCIQDKSNMALRARIDVLLKELDVQQSQWENPDLVIKWRRKVISEYNEESDIWEPKPRQIKDEKHILCIMPAKKFVDMALGRGDVDLDTHVSILKSQFESCKLIYLIEGLTAWQNQNRNVKDRQYQAAVRSRILEDEVASSSSNQRRKATQADEYIENADGIIEDSLLKLEVFHKVQHRLSTNTQDSAKWVAQFTKHISTIPYLAQREALGLNFCMAGGQFKSGKDTTDTYIKMLEEIHHVTEKMAEGIIAEYPTPQALLQGFKENGSSALEGCRKLANKNGALTDTKIGKAISRRVYKIFMEEEPESIDI